MSIGKTRTKREGGLNPEFSPGFRACIVQDVLKGGQKKHD
jgi:hypothetical protein